MSAGTPSQTAAVARSRNARASISVSFIKLSYRRAMPKPTQSSLNNADFTGVTPANCSARFRANQKHDWCELPPSLIDSNQRIFSTAVTLRRWCKAIQQSRPADYHPVRLVAARQPDHERDIAAGESAQG